MEIEEIEIDGQLITVLLPLSNIKVDGHTVSYTDSKGYSEQTFSTPSLARKFLLMLTELK